MGRHLSPRYGQVILVSGYPVLTAVNWLQHWCTICVQYQSSCATKLARKCEIEHWFSCGVDGRAGGLRAVYGHVNTKFTQMGRFPYPWCSEGALRAPELRYNAYDISVFNSQNTAVSFVSSESVRHYKSRITHQLLIWIYYSNLSDCSCSKLVDMGYYKQLGDC